MLMFFGTVLLFLSSFNINVFAGKNVVINMRSGFNFYYEDLTNVDYLNSYGIKDYFLDKLFENKDFLEKYKITQENKEQCRQIFKKDVLFQFLKCSNKNHNHSKLMVMQNEQCLFADRHNLLMRMWIFDHNIRKLLNDVPAVNTVRFNILELHKSYSANF